MPITSPSQFYTPHFYTTYCNSTATTTNYIPTTWYNTASSNITYPNWNPVTASASITAISNNAIWQTWVNMPQTTYGSGLQFQPYVPTAADRAAQEEREKERIAARARARVLLEEFLNQEQKVELEKEGRFHVTGSKGRRYCIRAYGQSGNVDLLRPDGQVQATLCAHPREGLPDGDAWLMQMIELRHDEDHFLRTANVHRGSLPIAA